MIIQIDTVRRLNEIKCCCERKKERKQKSECIYIPATSLTKVSKRTYFILFLQNNHHKVNRRIRDTAGHVIRESRQNVKLAILNSVNNGKNSDGNPITLVFSLVVRLLTNSQ